MVVGFRNYKFSVLDYGFSLLLSICTLVLLFVTFGFYWEDSEKLIVSVISGNLYSPPYEVWFDETLFLLISPLAHLCSYFPKLPVYGIAHCLVLALYLSLWFHLTLRVMARRIIDKPVRLILFSFLFVYTIIGICFVYVNVSRDSILMAAGSMLLYLDYHLAGEKKTAPFVLLFLFSCLLRVTAGILVLATITLFFILLFRNFKIPFRLLRFHWFIAVTCFIVLRIYYHIETDTGQMVQQTYEYAIQDRHAVVPLSEMRTNMDSIRYKALTGFFLITDSAQINMDFVRKVVDIKKYAGAGIYAEDIYHLTDDLLPALYDHIMIIGLFYFLLFVVAWGSDGRTKRSLILINTFCWLVIVGIGAKINMADHFLLPWLAMLFACSLFLVMRQNTRFGNLQKGLAFILLLAIFMVNTSEFFEIKSQEGEKNKKASSYLANVALLSKTAVPVLWDYSQVYFPTEVLSGGQSVIFKDCIYQTLFFVMYHKFGQERCFKKFGFSPLDWRAMNISFHKNYRQVRFVTKPKAADFLKIYYRQIYNMDFKLVKDYPVNEICPDNFVYHLESCDTCTSTQ